MSVMIYGATGWTGAQVTRALVERGVSVVLSGRSERKLRDLSDVLGMLASVRPAALDDRPALNHAAHGCRVVVNCAGPFVETGRPVLDAALAAGAHYLDVSGEKSHVAMVHEVDDARARRRGVSVCPGFGAKGGLGDWSAHHLAQRLPPDQTVDEVAVAYGHRLREFFRPSIGSALASAGQGFFPSGTVLRDASHRRRFHFPPPFGPGEALPVPAGEDVTIGRHVPAVSVRTFISLDPGGELNAPWMSTLQTAAPVMPWVARVLFSEWGRLHLRLYLPRPEVEHDKDSFALTIEVRAGEQSERLALVMHDAYSATAKIVSLGVLRLLAATPPPAGVLAPSELCWSSAMLRHLERLGAIRVHEPRADGHGWS